MPADKMVRQLRAILSADAVGYSRLMRHDEEATIRTITAYRQVISSLVHQHRGRVVDSPGDNVLAEFTSAVDAVNGAVEIQRELAERNHNLTEDRRMNFRIGLNLGDVFQEGDRLYGDGLNIAARLEGLAESGGVCVSGTVYDSIENKIGLEFEYLGEHEIKNVDKPIRVYKVRIENDSSVTAESTSKEKETSQLPHECSIAVLPFVNISDDPKQEYFCDGLTEGIIATVSKSPNLFVIARNSVFTYKGKPVKVQQVSADLGVRYVLAAHAQSPTSLGDVAQGLAQLQDVHFPVDDILLLSHGPSFLG